MQKGVQPGTSKVYLIKGPVSVSIHSHGRPKMLAPLVNMIKEGCEN